MNASRNPKTTGMKLLWLTLISLTILVTQSATAASPSRGVAILLTTGQIAKVNLHSGRTIVSAQVGLSRKVVSDGRWVFLLRRTTVEVRDAKTLRLFRTIDANTSVDDIAVSSRVLTISAGRHVQIFAIDAGGDIKPVGFVKIAKAAHAVSMVGPTVYAVDDVVRPFYVHHIDLTKPRAPRLTTLKLEAVWGHIVSQAIADRWYILVNHQKNIAGIRGYYVAALPLRPPLQIQARWDVPEPAEFRVYRGEMYWIAPGGDDHVWLHRQVLTNEGKAEKVAIVTPFTWPLPEGTGRIELVGDRLYVANGRTFAAFALNQGRGPVLVRKMTTQLPIVSFIVDGPGK